MDGASEIRRKDGHPKTYRGLPPGRGARVLERDLALDKHADERDGQARIPLIVVEAVVMVGMVVVVVMVLVVVVVVVVVVRFRGGDSCCGGGGSSRVVGVVGQQKSAYFSEKNKK